MKQYPKIPAHNKTDVTHFWVFDKLDGSNIRGEWSKKRGFYKFGSRKRLLGSDQGLLAKAEGLAKLIEGKIREVFKLAKIERATCFFEFVGPNSFAGNHLATDEHKLVLLDIDVYKHGMVSPGEFIKYFGDSDIEIPKLLHYGPIGQGIEAEIRSGTLQGMGFEGVVCKSRRRKKWENPVMYKIKNQAWIDKVKANFDKSKWEDLL